jgi:hypothetical protein
MDMIYPVKLQICLRPIWHQDPPEIKLGIDQELITVNLKETTEFNFECQAKQSCSLTIELLNKTNADTVPDQGLDKAVIIERINFFNIEDPRFVWHGIYEPDYPEPWASEQKKQGLELKKQLSNHNYLSWNGKWTLTFTVPVFTWIHHIQNLGWMYD